jgi:hypothetical protein
MLAEEARFLTMLHDHARRALIDQNIVLGKPWSNDAS